MKYILILECDRCGEEDAFVGDKNTYVIDQAYAKGWEIGYDDEFCGECLTAMEEEMEEEDRKESQ